MIERTNSGRWRITATHQGQKLRRTVDGSRADALRLESYLKHHGELPGGASPPGTRTLVQVVRHCAMSRWSQAKTRGQLEARAQQLVSILGESLSIDSLDRQHYSQVRHALELAGDAPATVRKKLELLRQILHEAHAMGWRVAPPELRGLLPQAQPRTRYLDEDETRRMLAAADPEFGQLLVTLVDTGVRLGELLAAHTGDLVDGGTALRVATLKGGAPRTLPLTSRVQQVLQARAQGAPDTPLWPGWDRGRVSYQWRKLRELTGLQDVTSHTLRHTCATRLLGQVDLRVVQSWLGHRSIASTARYAHTTPAHLAQAVNALEN